MKARTSELDKFKLYYEGEPMRDILRRLRLAARERRLFKRGQARRRRP